MKKIRVFLQITLVCIVMLMMFDTSTKAANYSDTTGRFLYALYVVQDKSNWCWAASAENAIIWEMHPDLTQWDAVYQLKGYPTNPYPNFSGSIFDSRDAAKYISEYTESYYAIENFKSFYFLQEMINDNHPIINGAGYYNSLGNRTGGHATLIFGWCTNTGVERITYYDSDTDTRETCLYSAFCDGSYNGRKYDQTCYHIGS